jgi:hypothetical protein
MMRFRLCQAGCLSDALPTSKELKIIVKQNHGAAPGHPETKKSGLKVVTLIATLNPVSQVLW